MAGVIRAISTMATEVESTEHIARPLQDTGTLSEENVDLWGVILILARAWRRIAMVTLGGLIVGLAVSLLSRPTFTATATILPPQQTLSTASTMMMGQLGSLAGAGSLAGGLGLKSPADMYIGILESRTIADHVISTAHLRELYKTKTLVDARAALKKHVTFETGKDNLIHLSVKDYDPNRASDIANSYLDQLYNLNSDLAISEASQRRAFYDQRLAEEKTALSDAEIALRNTQQKTGLILLSGQAASIINSIAQARAQLAAREVQLQSMRTFATEENPDTVRLQEEIAALRSNLVNLENSQRTIQPGDIQLPTSQVPEAALEYGRQTRELKYHETLFELLSRQAEAARLDEAKSAPIIQVVDRAVPPDKKSGPPRTLITIGCAFFGFCVACLWSLAAAALERMEQIPEQAQKLRDLRSAFFP
jgi:tyrosine-protein kinase Etk/Wzc